MIKQHCHQDTTDAEKEKRDTFTKRLDRARKKIEKLDKWLNENEDKVSKRGRISQSNITDNESAKMKTSHGVIQGYNGISVVDAKHQVVVNAEAFGESQDVGLLKPTLEGTKEMLKDQGESICSLQGSIVTADTGFHSTENLAYLAGEKIDGYIPDCNFRKRDPRFASAARHKRDSAASQWGTKHFTRADFNYVKRGDYFLCPAGNRLEYNKSDLTDGTVTYRKYVSKIRFCKSCSLREQCLTRKNHKVRSVFMRSDRGEKYCDHMSSKIDTEAGRKVYSKRMGIVEPVFGNLRWAKGLSRFTLRGKKKVNVQWLLYCIVHNVEKICNYGQPVFI